MNLHPFYIHEQVIKATRAFFDTLGFEEVITPLLTRGLPMEPNIYAFETGWKNLVKQEKLFLSTSPESGLKKMIAAGICNCYAISSTFRNLEGSGPQHTPEFLMLEWYRENATYEAIMADVKALVMDVKKHIDRFLGRPESTTLTYQSQQIDLAAVWPVYTMAELFDKYAGLNLTNILTDVAMVKAATEKGYHTEGATWSQLFDQIYLNEIEPKLPVDPYFIKDFPARISPLCKLKTDNPNLAERFEVFLGGMEIGNGNNENTDRQMIEPAFKNELEQRCLNGLPVASVDEEFLAAAEKMNGRSYAGIGLGIDRLAMIMADVNDIRTIAPLRIS